MSWNAPFPLREGEDLTAMKMRFAELRVKFPGTNPIQLIENILTGDDNVGRAYQALNAWSNDIQVLEAIEDFKKSGSTSKTNAPDKEEFAQEILSLARAIEADDAKNKIEALKLYATVKGFIEKPGVTFNNNTLTVNKVMRLPAAQSDDVWELKLKEQQERLINVTPT